MAHTRILKIEKGRIYLTPEINFSIGQTSHAECEIGFRTHEVFYWEVEVKSFNKQSETLYLQVLNYRATDSSSFKNQKVSENITKLHLGKLDWKYLEPQLYTYRTGIKYMSDLIIDGIPQPEKKEPNRFDKRDPKTAQDFYEFRREYVAAPRTSKIIEDFDFAFVEAKFGLGVVSFQYKSKQLNKLVSVKIENSFILPEFDAIKYYFPKAFKKKKFQVHLEIVFTDHEVTSVTATSTEISLINQELIDSIKRERTNKLISLDPKIDKGLFTSDDLFDNFEEGADGNVFNQTEEDILDLLMKREGLRNGKQLQYLSGKKHSPSQKIRFTLKPDFGFLFFIEGEQKHHFCWELLDSHATYVWSLEKNTDIERQYRRIEETINLIRVMRREKYLKAYRNNVVDTDISFHKIPHTDVNSDIKDGFVEWKHRFKECLL